MDRVIVTGSLAFDHIMNFEGHFSDYILPEQVHKLNLSFAVDTLHKQRGGCAGNIAYNLSLLGEHPIILGVAGEDFSEYKRFLQGSGTETGFIREIYGESSSMGFGIADESDNQIWAYYAGAMKYAKELSLAKILAEHKPQPQAVSRPSSSRFSLLRPSSGANPFLAKKPEPEKTKDEEEKKETEPPKLNREEIKLLVVAPNDVSAMMNFVHEAKTLYIPYIFDPGMQIPNFDKELLIKAIDGAKVLIGNDYEIALIMELLNVREADLLRIAEYLIITKGPRGSIIMSQNERHEIPPAIPKHVIDATGAGDAYRAGIIYGLLHKLPAPVMGCMGSLLAAYTVETYGTTTHAFKIVEFKKRYHENFNEKLEL